MVLAVAVHEGRVDHTADLETLQSRGLDAVLGRLGLDLDAVELFGVDGRRGAHSGLLLGRVHLVHEHLQLLAQLLDLGLEFGVRLGVRRLPERKHGSQREGQNGHSVIHVVLP